MGNYALVEASKVGVFNRDVVQIGDGVSAAQTQLFRDMSNNLLLIFSDGSQLTIKGYFSNASNQPAIAFADGTRWDYNTIANHSVFTDTSAGNNTLNAINGANNQIVGAAGDTIFAGNLNDTITAGRNNIVYAGSGVDTFVVNQGSGHVVLHENYHAKSAGQNQDVVQLGAGITASATRVGRDLAGNLVLDFGNGDTLSVAGYLGNGSGDPVFVFADGTKWDYTTVTNSLVFTDTSAGGNTLNAINGANNQIVGAAGDTIWAGNRADTITAGRNNIVYAGSGVDTFVVNQGSGHVVLHENIQAKSSGQNQDVVRLGAGIAASATRAGRDLAGNLVLDFGNG